MEKNASASMVTTVPEASYGEVSWERMIRAVEKVRERLRRAASALELLRDLIQVGLLNAAFIQRLPGPLGARLQELLDNLEG